MTPLIHSEPVHTSSPTRLRPRLCILSFSRIEGDGRVLRQIKYASARFDVHVIGFGNWTPTLPSQSFVSLKRDFPEGAARTCRLLRLIAGHAFPPLWKSAYWSCEHCREALANLCERGPFDLLHANDLEALPVAVEAAKRCGGRVVFDAHEYYPEQAQFLAKRRKWIYAPYHRYLLRKYLARVDAFVTVSPGLAALYRDNFGADAEVVRNVPEYVGVPFRPVDPKMIQLVHHGGAKRARRLETLIEMMGHLDRAYTLTLFLVEHESPYARQLQGLAASIAPGRIFVRPAPAPGDIVPTISGFDLGVHVLPPIGLNHIHALPNKVFEYINAGLAVVVGTGPDVADLVRKTDVGVAVGSCDAAEIAAAIRSLTPTDIDRCKRNSLEAAKTLNANVEMGKLLEIYDRLLDVEAPSGPVVVSARQVNG